MAIKQKPEILTTTVTTKKHSIKVSGELLVSLLKAVPKNTTVRVTVQVPGGGDWSNTHINISDECPVWVEWEESKVEDTRS